VPRRDVAGFGPIDDHPRNVVEDLGGAMADQSVLLDKVRLYFDTPGGDVEHALALYHDDAVLEFPQSGERFEGRANFTEWRSRYPVDVSHRLRRVTVRDDLVVVELSANYDGGATMYGVALMEFRDDKIARERIYVMEGWEAPEWRKAWRSETPADPLD
jgi:ketosteroid isomerase-like protein